MREIALTNGERMRLYDTSGPYTDPDYTADLKQGLPPAAAPLDPRARRRGAGRGRPLGPARASRAGA